MKHSITRKITGIMIGLVTGTVILCWFINTILLERYYMINKQDTLTNAFDQINVFVDKDELNTQEASDTLTSIFSESNITMMIIENDGAEVAWYTNNFKKMKEQFQRLLLGIDTIKIVENASHYEIGQVRDVSSGIDYLILMGTLNDEAYILLQTPQASIRESVWIANRFLTYVGIFAIVLSAFISFFVTKWITNPIRQLAEISKRMKNLDFEAKYVGKGKSEIDMLGDHMNQMSQELEHTISELKSANNELKQDIENKNQLDLMRKEFVSNVSHELKTPLALIQGYAEGLKECINDDEESREFYCDVIMDEADKMNKMVKQILSLNQLESGYETVVMERFNIVELIQGVIQSTAILREQNQIELTFYENGPIYVWADEFKTEEVIVNYMSNAINHVQGKKEISVFITEKENTVRISVFNTGAPIPENDLEHIWTKFYKVDKARTREYGGSGIGLSIVKAIMESFHRECGVINHQNGVEFWFELDNQSR